jgi:hypothetical protein
MCEWIGTHVMAVIQMSDGNPSSSHGLMADGCKNG